jgi:hypothetical protein
MKKAGHAEERERKTELASEILKRKENLCTP